MTETNTQQRVVMVTGPSGAGRSSAIRALEDMGYEAIDNLPLSLVPRLLEGPPLPRPLALGIDVRNRDFSTEALAELADQLNRRPGVSFDLLYIDCDIDTLLRRYSETRRRHPLSPVDSPRVGLELELGILEPVKALADVLIDSSDLSPHQLRGEIARWFAPPSGAPMALSVQSFSYKRGLPRGVDMVFDCRFLANPHWDPALRPHDGRDPAVAAYVAADPRFDDFFARVHGLITSLLDAFVDEGKASLTIAFGCTGGKHRSVATAERLSAALAQDGWRVATRHRELERQPARGPSGEQG